MNRREFLGTAGVAAGAAAAAPVDLSLQCRQDFPRGMNETYFNSAAQHPLGNHCAAGMQRYIDFMQKGPGDGRRDFWEEGFLQVKPMFAKLINANPRRSPSRAQQPSARTRFSTAWTFAAETW